MDGPQIFLKHAGLLWLAGFREACCFHRGFLFCRRSPELLKRTGQCFLLNGFIFLGSLFVLYLVINPILLWILPNQCQQFGACDLCGIEDILKFYSTLRHSFIKLFYIFWFYPLYVFSIILSNFWYNDIAKLGFTATGIESSRHNELSNAKSMSHAVRHAGAEGVLIGIAEQAYSLLLVTIFFIEVYATSFIPYIGKAINFLLLSWMYAYYCFEYKWNLTQLALDKRLDFFESNWAFFLGFGSPCVLAIFFFSQLVSYGVMAILFPLFVLTALGTQEEQVIDFQRKSWRGTGLGRLPLFNAANTIAMKVLHIIFGSPDKGNLAKKDS